MTGWGEFTWGHSFWGGSALPVLITDRTKADWQEWLTLSRIAWDLMTAAQKTRWLTDLKGAYNASDLNRVESAVQYVTDRLNAAGFNLHPTVKTDWAMADIPGVADMERYRQNAATIRAALSVFSSTPQTPESMRFLNWVKANNIEQILVDVDTLLNYMSGTIDAAWASGMAYTGLYFAR